MLHSHRAKLYAGCAAVVFASICIGLFALIRTNAFTVGFSGSDEPSHYLNGYFVSLYLKYHFGENPLTFAKEYYLHYPKISIGHWPPAFYGIMSLLYFAFPASFKVAFSINLAFQIAVATFLAITVNCLTRTSLAIAAAVTYSLSPISVESVVMFMPDGAVAAFAIASAASWLAYTIRPRFTSAMVFTGCAATAVLIKGNGWLVALIPVFHMLLTNQWCLLASRKLYAAVAIGSIIVVPWYLFTAKLAADGFNYQAGFAYATHALAFNTRALMSNVTMLGLSLACIGAFTEFMKRKASPRQWMVSATCLSLIMATLTFQSIIPVDTVDRYMAPALPAVFVFAALGINRIVEFLSQRIASPRFPCTLVVLACYVYIASNGLSYLAYRNPKADIHASEVVKFINRDSQPHAVLIDGSAEAEGAVIAAFAVKDDELHNYVVRASKVLAQSNFMGSNYSLQYRDAEHALSAIDHLGIRYIVIIRNGSESIFAHGKQLDEALSLPQSNYEEVLDLPIRNGSGSARVFLNKSISTPNVEGINRISFPAKVQSIQ